MFLCNWKAELKRNKFLIINDNVGLNIYDEQLSVGDHHS